MALGNQVPDKTLLKAVSQKLIQRSGGSGCKLSAAVNGGTGKYVDAFLSKEYSEQNPDEKNQRLQQDLKTALKLQLKTLAEGLRVFAERSDPSLKGLVDHLSSFYRQMTDKYKPVLGLR